MSLQIELKPRRDILVVRLSGELDHHTADGVRRQIDEAIVRDGYTHLVFSLRELTFMDSSGLGVILGRYKRINQQNGTLAVCALSPAVKKLFDLSGMHKILRAYEREEEALASLGVAS
ncbi:anti-sigma F factor antagonist [Numidum massiliense]|uniref:anti-sigma F factor antagonist n=1 Tax=Numidum massiliense TaxID=1522315 RepID=UPI0006D57989|nr:anti-sigma F factor antagonist [Numidum massiliense]